VGVNPNGNWGYAEGSSVGITIYAFWRYTHLWLDGLWVVVWFWLLFLLASVIQRRMLQKKKTEKKEAPNEGVRR